MAAIIRAIERPELAVKRPSTRSRSRSRSGPNATSRRTSWISRDSLAASDMPSHSKIGVDEDAVVDNTSAPAFAIARRNA